ncbi:MAG: stage II sporulation protein M [Oenococcus sp.]|uniref:stage II sporulation protein M n=1 Tax=Oenococcus sp. TaxID=1979414 RepID=UPI0039E764B3
MAVFRNRFSQVFLIKKKPLLTACTIFAASFVVTAILLTLFLNYQHAATNLPIDLKSQIKDFTFVQILFKNLIVALILVSGFFLIKIPTILALIVNAAVLAFILAANIYTTGAWLYFILLVSIHGVTELAALFIAANIGFQKINLAKKQQRKQLVNTMLLIVVLLALAAILETCVTPLFWR